MGTKRDRERWIHETQEFQKIAGVKVSSKEKLGEDYDEMKKTKKTVRKTKKNLSK